MSYIDYGPREAVGQGEGRENILSGGKACAKALEQELGALETLNKARVGRKQRRRQE